jgi:hypothetical protein
VRGNDIDGYNFCFWSSRTRVKHRCIDRFKCYNSYTASSVGQFSTTSAALLRKTNVDYVKPEQVKAFELGYRSFISDVSVDINGYYNIYNDFMET